MASAGGGRGFNRRENASDEPSRRSAGNVNKKYSEHAPLIKRFLEQFHPDNPDWREEVNKDDARNDPDAMEEEDDLPKYLSLIRQCARRQRIRLPVFVDDLIEYFAGDASGLEIATGVEGNTLRYMVLFCEQVDLILKERFRDDVRFDTDDVADVFVMHRATVAGDDEHAFPPSLMRRYELYFTPRRLVEPIPLRLIRSAHIGHLVKTRGIVIRASELMPQLLVATYVCDRCAAEIYQEVATKVYMPEVKCKSKMCKSKMGKVGTLHMQNRGSRFVKFQEVRIQELPEEVPVGHVPRSIACQVKGENTRRVSPGDIVHLDGVLLPQPFSGYQAMNAGLITDTYMNVMRLQRQLKSYSEYRLTPQLLQQVDLVSRSADAYTRLAMSIAPEIYGHLDVKKALLLQMVGGVTRRMSDGMMIRGDINVCLIGDPGVAKSQLLKHIAHIAPRGIYTSGKGSSGVGLTAAVMKDAVSGEFVLEGGSLVLADMGICCIDEFDKMADADRTSIHEVMEQQSISIAKAGITCSLNARAAILAAANPAYGRYNTSRTPSENINLPAALLSRFDLLFLLLDKPNWERDMALAKHIAHVHIHSAAPALDFEPFSSEFLRSYIAKAKSFEPFVPEYLSDHIVSAYVNMREMEVKDMENAKSYTTARTLLAILRLSQALAKLKFANEVTSQDVDEAIRLMNSSKSSLAEDPANAKAASVDTMSAIFDIIRSASAATDSATVSYNDVMQRAVRKGYRQEDVQRTIEQYSNLGVFLGDCRNLSMATVRAIADFQSSEKGELSLKKGDILTLLEKDDSGWSKGLLNGVKGWFPSDFCVVVETEAKVEAKEVKAAVSTIPISSVAVSAASNSSSTTSKVSPRVGAQTSEKKGETVKASPRGASAASSTTSSSTSNVANSERKPTANSIDRPVPAFASSGSAQELLKQQQSAFSRVGNIQQIVSPRGNKISLLTKYPRSDNAEEDNVLNIFVTSDSKKQDLISELLGAGNSSGASKFYSEALQMYEGYLDEIFKALKMIAARESQGLPAPTSPVDPLNAGNVKRLLDVFRNFCLALASQESTFGLRESVFVITNLAKQLKLPNPVVETKKAKKGAEAPQQPCTVLEFLLGTISALLSLAQNNTDSPNQIATLANDKDVFRDLLDLCFNSLAGSNSTQAKKSAGECLGALSGSSHLDAVVTMFTSAFSKCKSEEDYRQFSHYQRGAKFIRFSFDKNNVAVLFNYLSFIVQNEARFTASSLKNAYCESLIESFQETQAAAKLAQMEDDLMRANIANVLYKIYELALKKWLKNQKTKAWSFKLAMYCFLLFDAQRKDLSKKEILKFFLDQLKDAKQRVEGIDSFSIFLRTLPPDFSQSNAKVWKTICAEALPALFVKKSKDVSSAEWKELTGVLSCMFALDDSLLTDATLISVLKTSDFNLESKCVVLRAMGGCILSSSTSGSSAAAVVQLQQLATPIISQFCLASENNLSALLPSILVCFPALVVPEQRRAIASSLVPRAFCSDPELWTCALQALQRLLLEEPETYTGFILSESFKFLRPKLASDEAVVHVRGIALLLSSFANTRKNVAKGSGPVPTFETTKTYALCWALHPDHQVREEALRVLQLVGQIVGDEDALFTLLSTRRVRFDAKSDWVKEVSIALVEKADAFESAVRESWILLKEPPLRLDAYSEFFCKTLHIAVSGENSQSAFDVVSSMMSVLLNEDASMALKSHICESMELMHESVVESVARIALSEMQKRQKGTAKPAATLRATSNKKVSAQTVTEIAMLRCFSVLMRKVSPITFGHSAFLKSFARERSVFWLGAQLDFSSLEVFYRVHLVELLRCCLLLEQAEFKSAQMSDESMSLIQSVVSVTPNSVDENSSSFQIAVATAFRDFFRFCYVSTSSLSSNWINFSLSFASTSTLSAVHDLIADAIAGIVERFPTKLILFVIDALKNDSNALVFLALCKSFDRKTAFWVNKSVEYMLLLTLLKMTSTSTEAREKAVALANVLAKEELAPSSKSMFYIKGLEMNMYLQAAMEYSKDISEKKLNLTSALTIAFASVFTHLSDQQKTLSLMLLQPWMRNFSAVADFSPEGANAVLDSLIKMSVDSDAVFHRDNLQRLFTSLALKTDGHVKLVVDFIVSRYSSVPSHCTFCLSSMMTTSHAANVVAVLLSHLRRYPELVMSDSLAASLKTVDDFAEKDAKASAAFKMLEYVSLENSKLLLGSIPILLHCSLLYYRSSATVCNILLSMQRSGSDTNPALAKLIDVLKAIDLYAPLQKDTVQLILDGFSPVFPSLQSSWAEIALQWGLGCGTMATALGSLQLWSCVETHSLSLAKAQQVAAFCFVCLHNGWLMKLSCLLDAAVKMQVVVEQDAKAFWINFCCCLILSCTPFQVVAGANLLKCSSLSLLELNASLRAVAGSESLYRASLMRAFFLESSKDSGVFLVRSIVANSKSGGIDFATELVLVMCALTAQQTEVQREEVYAWISGQMTQLANFVEVFSRKGFHLRQWDRRKFCFDFVGLLLQKFGSKSAAMDILLVLIRNSSVEAFKPACFRLVNALLELSPTGVSRNQFKLLAELAQLSVYSSNSDLRLAAEQVLLDLISQYVPDTVPQSMLTLVRVMPASLSAFEKQDRHLFPGDTEQDFVLALKRSEVALAKILNSGTQTLLAEIRDQQRVKTSDLEDSNIPAVQPAKQQQVSLDHTPVVASSVSFVSHLVDESTPNVSEPPK